MSNVAALTEVLDHVEAHPDLHHQDEWVCSTTACIAGWAVALHHGLQAGDMLSRGSDCFLRGDDISETAQALLGLTDRERGALFSAYPERTAIRLGRAIAARDEGNPDHDQRLLLAEYYLPTDPPGDAATWTPGGAA